MGWWGGQGVRDQIAEWRAEVVMLRSHIEQLRAEVGALRAQIERGSTVAIRADLDNLSGRVETLASSTQKSLGKLWQRERAPIERHDDGTIAASGTGDPELDDLLAIQEQWSRRPPSGDSH